MAVVKTARNEILSFFLTLFLFLPKKPSSFKRKKEKINKSKKKRVGFVFLYDRIVFHHSIS